VLKVLHIRGSTSKRRVLLVFLVLLVLVLVPTYFRVSSYFCVSDEELVGLRRSH
jgi:hypothetical protein